MMLNWHKKQLELVKEKLGLSYYSMMWIAYIKGLLFGLIMYHFFLV